MNLICDLLSFLNHIAPALVTVALGGFLIHRFFIRRSNIANIIDSICEKLAGLKSDCASYWSIGYAETEKSKLSILEANIKASLTCIEREIRFLNEKYKINITKQQAEMLTLMDCCTGGDFESKNRKANKERFFKIVNSTNEIAFSLQHNKI